MKKSTKVFLISLLLFLILLLTALIMWYINLDIYKWGSVAGTVVGPDGEVYSSNNELYNQYNNGQLKVGKTIGIIKDNNSFLPTWVRHINNDSGDNWIYVHGLMNTDIFSENH